MMAPYNNDVDQVMDGCTCNGYCPLLTPKEMDDLGLEDDMTDDELQKFNNYRKTLIMSTNYGEEIREEYTKYKNFGSDDSKLLNMGWIPSVEPNDYSFGAARRNLRKYVESAFPKVNDVSCMNASPAIIEAAASDKMRLHPIFLVSLYVTSTIGGLTANESSLYSHSAIGFAPELDKLYSYAATDNGTQKAGLVEESLEKYINDSSFSKILVTCIFVSHEQYSKLMSNIEWYAENPTTGNNSIANVFNIVVGRDNTNDRYNLSIICSQFVDAMLKLINADLTNKPSSEVSPTSIAAVVNPTVYKLYEGSVKDYDINKARNTVTTLSSSAEQVRSTVYESTGFYGAPKSIFTEVNFPIQFNDKGDLEIETYKSYEQKYQEVHTLLKSTTDPNDIANCLCILWNANCNIEKRLQKMRRKKKDSEQYKDYVKLRSRILNDFNKYLRKLNDDTRIQFYEYYKKSPYYDGSMKIKRSTLNNVGAYIKALR